MLMTRMMTEGDQRELDEDGDDDNAEDDVDVDVDDVTIRAEMSI